MVAATCGGGASIGGGAARGDNDGRRHDWLVVARPNGARGGNGKGCERLDGGIPTVAGRAKNAGGAGQSEASQGHKLERRGNAGSAMSRAQQTHRLRVCRGTGGNPNAPS